MKTGVKLLLFLLLAGGLALVGQWLNRSVQTCNINGTITRNGEALRWKTSGGHLLVIYIPEDRTSDRNVYRAETNRDTGTYTIHEIPRGNYLVAIQQFDEKHNDALNHKYNPGATTLQKRVTADGEVLDIDLP
jgi:hypothetical protein